MVSVLSLLLARPTFCEMKLYLIFFSKCFSRALCKSKCFDLFAREEALPIQALQEALGCVRNVVQCSPGPTERGGVGTALTPVSGITDSVHHVSLLLETCLHLGPQTAEIRAGICSDQKEGESNFSPVRTVMRQFTNPCRDPCEGSVVWIAQR